MNKAILVVVLIAFAVLTAFSIHSVGGVLELVLVHLGSPAGWQIFADLLITMGLLLVWVWRDARATGRAFWPWAMFSITCGAFGPLLYFITAKRKP